MAALLLRLADHYFDRNKMSMAEITYNRVLAIKESNLHSYARFKLAWVSANNSKFKQAFERFEKVVNTPKQIANHDLEMVRSEALMGLVFCYTRVGDSSKALEYFSRLPFGKQERLKAIETLANSYNIRENYQAALPLYKYLQKHLSDPEMLMEYKHYIEDIEIILKQIKKH